MAELKGTRTEKNLLAAFAGESQARNRYTYFASVARAEGYEQVSAIFLETADNEKEHAKRFYKLLVGGELEITASYPAGVIGDTASNLEAAAAGENLEWTRLYREAADTARGEHLEEAAQAFASIAAVEKEHEARYTKLLSNVRNSTVFNRSSAVDWKCRNCGYVHKGREAPAECPACAHARKFFEIKAENY